MSQYFKVRFLNKEINLLLVPSNLCFNILSKNCANKYI